MIPSTNTTNSGPKDGPTIDHAVAFSGGADLPVYLRVTQADGNQAWTSPIYLIS